MSGVHYAAGAPLSRRAGSLRARLLWFLLAAIVLAVLIAYAARLSRHAVVRWAHAAVGLGYAMLQRPSCGYGDSIFCW